MTDTPPRVSVVIASNRGGPYLRAAVESVRRQTVPVEEIILVDDGSPAPGLADVAQDLGVVYLHQPPSGVSAARNLGVHHARGEWVALLDDDDIWYPSKIELQLSALAESPDAIACFSDMRFIDAEGAIVGKMTCPAGTSEELIARGNGVPPISTLLIRRDAYCAVGGCDEQLRYAEDVDLILRLLRTGTFVKAAEALTGYRRYPGQATSDGFASLSGYVRALERLIERARDSEDERATRLLTTHLENTMPGIADWSARETFQRLRRREWGGAWQAARWGIAHTRSSYFAALYLVPFQKLQKKRTEPISETPR